jgi:hypothetical protein
VLKAIEAVIDAENNIRLLESVSLSGTRRAVLIVLDEPAVNVPETALLSEPALAEDWDRPEEDAAWSYLRQAP